MTNSVAKVIEICSSSDKSIEDAVQGGLKKVSRSVKNIKGAWLNDIKVVTADDGTITEWRVDMKVTFIVGKE
jgi:dodecin